jgi:hypothetical protein
MYNLEVAQDHTFVVGMGMWVVHNCGDALLENIRQSWHPGTYASAEESFMAHFEKHGEEVEASTAEQYLNKAKGFASNVMGGKSDGYRLVPTPSRRYINNGRIIWIADEEEHRILSFAGRTG